MERPLGSLQAVDWNHFKQYWPHLADIRFPTPIPNGSVDLIIGMDHPILTEHLTTRRSSHSDQVRPTPIAVYTRLGWTAGGPLLPQQLLNTALPPKLSIEKPHTNARALLEAVLMDPKGPSGHLYPLQDNHPAHGVSLPDLLKLLPPQPDRPPGVLLNAEDRAAMHKMYQETIKLPQRSLSSTSIMAWCRQTTKQ